MVLKIQYRCNMGFGIALLGIFLKNINVERLILFTNILKLPYYSLYLPNSLSWTHPKYIKSQIQGRYLGYDWLYFGTSYFFLISC